MRRSTGVLALCFTVFIAVVGPSGCSRDRQESAGETPVDEFDRHVEAGYHPSLVRMYLRLRDGHAIEWYDEAWVRRPTSVTHGSLLDALAMWRVGGDGPALLSAGDVALGPEGRLLMEDVRVERTGLREMGSSAQPETMMMACGAMSGKCEVVGDGVQVKLFDVTSQEYPVGDPQSVVVGSHPEIVFVIDLGDFDP